MPTVVSTPRIVAAPVTAAATLAGGRHYPANATAGAFTLTLPTGQAQGVEISVEKTDSTGNAVTLSGSVRGAAGTIALALQRETVLLMSDATGSWWPVVGPRVLPSASTTAVGMIEVATDAEAITGTATTLAVTPAALRAVLAQLVAPAVVWNKTNGTWGDRPGWAVRAIFMSTDDPAATVPSDIDIKGGDVWLRHPNATV